MSKAVQHQHLRAMLSEKVLVRLVSLAYPWCSLERSRSGGSEVVPTQSLDALSWLEDGEVKYSRRQQDV